MDINGEAADINNQRDEGAVRAVIRHPPTEKGEYDHLVSIELGGAVDDPRNLWVEVGSIPNPKDAVENGLNHAICADLITLTVAQTAIAHQWVTAFDDAGLQVTGGKICLRDNPARCVGH